MAYRAIAALGVTLGLAFLVAAALWGCGSGGLPGLSGSAVQPGSTTEGLTSDGKAGQTTTTSQTTTTVPGPVTLGPRTPCLEAELVSVIDGDTIKVRLRGGSSERVRLIGVDAPEWGEPLAALATQELARIVGRGPVFLEFDLEKRDKYGRLLAYVWVPGSRPTGDVAVSRPQGGSDPGSKGAGGGAGLAMANLELLRAGLAVLYTVPPNVAYVEELRRAQEEARADERGIWGATGASVTK